MKRIWPFLPALLLAGSAAFGADATCSTTTGAPPIQTKAPEGRIATPYASDTFETGTGFHWDEWYRDASQNLDAQAIDHFLQTMLDFLRKHPLPAPTAYLSF